MEQKADLNGDAQCLCLKSRTIPVKASQSGLPDGICVHYFLSGGRAHSLILSVILHPAKTPVSRPE